MVGASGVTLQRYHDHNSTFSMPVTETLNATLPSVSLDAAQYMAIFYAVPLLAILVILAIICAFRRSRKFRKPSETKKQCLYLSAEESVSCLTTHTTVLPNSIQNYQATQVVFSRTNEPEAAIYQKLLKNEKIKQKRSSKQTIAEKRLTNEGLTLHCGQYKLEFPPDAVSTPVHVKVSIEPSSDVELDGSKLFPIAPILRCEPSGLKFKKDFKIKMQSSFSSQLKSDLAKVHILVRQSVENPFQGESVTRLGCDGRTTFYANHFSDREPTVDSRDVSHVCKYFCSFGFVKTMTEGIREFTWYLLDKCDNSFDRIKSLHSNEDVSVPFFTFSVDMNHSIRMKLSAEENDVHFNLNVVNIEPEIVRDMAAKSFKFLLTRSLHSNSTISIIYYQIMKFVAHAVNQETVESLTTAVGNFFSVAWLAKDNSQTSIIFGDTVHHYHSQPNEPIFNTFPRSNRQYPAVTAENSLAVLGTQSRRETHIA